MPNFTSTTPILRVRDVLAAVDYYVDKLGFQQQWVWGEPPNFACVVRDETAFFLSLDCQGQFGTWVYVNVDDVDAVYEQYQQSGARIVQPPTNFPWGMREMNVEDLDGHRLRIGSPTEAAADEGASLPLT